MTNLPAPSSRPAWLRKFLDFFGLRRSIVAVLGMVILVGMGENLAERFLPIYILALGGGSWVVSALNGLDNLLSALYSFPGGYLSDRLGYKRALIVFNLVAMGGYLIVILVPSWPAVLVGSVFFLSWSALSLPATMSLVAAVLPNNKRTMGVSMHSLVRRIPMALGPLVGGALIAAFGEQDGVRLAFVVALVLGVIALVLQQIWIKEVPAKSGGTLNPFKALYLISPDLRNLLISDILIRFCEQIPYAFMAIWALKYNSITPVQFGLLTTVEMITAVLVYIPVAYLADRSTKKPFVLITFVFFALFPMALFLARSFELMILAFILRGLKEFGEPTRKALIMDLAPEGQKAQTFGVYYLVRDVIVSLAAFSAGMLWDISPAVNFLVATAFGAAGVFYFAFFGKDLSAKGQGVVK